MKTFFAIIILCLSLSLKSQMRYGVFAGPQVTDVRYMLNDVKQESAVKFGMNAGFQFKIPFENRLYFSPSVMYNLRGYDVKFDSPSFPPDSSAIDNVTSMHTLELAFLLQHDFTLKPGHFFFRIGPSLDFVLTGNEKFNSKSGITTERKMIFGFAEYGHYLASAIFQLGYESKSGVYFYGHYNYGLVSLNNFDGGPGIFNRAAGISVGKYFRRK
jgi:hypothetical protein